MLLLLGVGAPAAENSSPYSFSTLAGAASLGSVDGAGAAARFSGPSAVALAASGTVYVADSNNHTIRRISATGVVSTLAGEPGQAGSEDGKGAAAHFNYPMAVGLDAQGNLYVADRGNRTIRKIAPDGTVSTLAGAVGLRGTADGLGTAARFDDPRGVAVDAAGNVFVTEYSKSTIRKITPAGAVSTFAGNAGESGHADGTGTAARFFNPLGIAVDLAGTIYVGDRQVVRKISPAGAVNTLAGNYGVMGSVDGSGAAARFRDVWGVTADAAGNIYVADRLGATLRKITAAGEVTTLAGLADSVGDDDDVGPAARFASPAGVAALADGSLVVADVTNNTIRAVSGARAVTTLAGLSPFASAGAADGTGGAARFYRPDGIALGPTGDLWVADAGNHTIRKVSPAGVVTTVAGLAGSAGFANGSGAEARFSNPLAVAADTLGNIYVADSANCVVRKITPAGIVSTFAGMPGTPGYTDGAIANARFTYPSAITLDATGNVYVVDGSRVRRIGTDGQVSSFVADTLAHPHTFFMDVAVDSAGNVFVSDQAYADIVKFTPAGTLSRIVTVHSLEPNRLAIDRNGRLFMTDYRGTAIGQLQADGTIKVIAGRLFDFGHQDGVASAARFNGASGLAVDAVGNLYVASDGVGDNTIRQGRLGAGPVITTPPQSQSVAAGGSVQFAVVATGDPAPAYQWYFNGAVLAGATGSSYTISSVGASAAGDYTVVVVNPFGSVTSGKAALTVGPPAGPTPPPANSGGGGAPSLWFIASLAGLGSARRLWRSREPGSAQ